MSYHLAKFGGHRHCCSRDITGLMLHVTLQNHVIKGLYEFMEGSFSLYISTLPNLVATGTVLVDMILGHTPAKFCGHRHHGSGDIFLVCHVISQDLVTKE